jgi:protoporphyrinogen oxidase
MLDTVIVGGGIAGLSIAEHLHKHTDNVITILEQYPSVGGRVATERGYGLYGDIQYESGAGRFHQTHKRVHALVERFGLKTFPISDVLMYNSEQNTNTFSEMFAALATVLHALDPVTLRTNTIGDLVPSELHPLFRMFPYSAEIHDLRADIALPLFSKDGEMGTYENYYGIVGGNDQLIKGLQSALKQTKVDIRTRYRVEEIQRTDGIVEIIGSYGKKKEAKPFQIRCMRVILATEYNAFKGFAILQNSPFLTHLTSSPLLRIYAIYPYDKTNEKVWFHDVPKMVVDSPLRFIIPISAEKGLIMISYTDGNDTKIWRERDGDVLQAEIQKEVRRLFPDRTIPEPTFLKKHDWTQGCTYWKKGDYDLEKTLLEAQNPCPNVYICGESVNKHQSWVESALESAERLAKELS